VPAASARAKASASAAAAPSASAPAAKPSAQPSVAEVLPKAPKPAPRAQIEDDPPVPSATVKPAASAVIEWERPPEGLQRGKWAAPRWAVITLGIVIVVLTLVYFVVRLRRIRAESGGA